MRDNNKKILAASRQNGGGNFDSSRLALGLRALIKGRLSLVKGRLSSFSGVMVAVLFAFIGTLALTSCSDDKEEPLAEPNYADLLRAHDWEIYSAYQHITANFELDVKDVDFAFCHLSADSIYFTTGETVTYFDANGKVVKTQYEVNPCGSYPYAVADDKIKIDNQTFKITSTTHTFVLENEGWTLVLKKKE